MEPVLNYSNSSASYDSNNNGNDGQDIIRWFEEVADEAGSVQTQILSQILKQNHGVEYLNKWLGDYNTLDMDATALESLFTSVVPLASHEDFEPFIQRIADGETSPLLTRQPTINALSLRYLTFVNSSSFIFLGNRMSNIKYKPCKWFSFFYLFTVALSLDISTMQCKGTSL